MTFDLEASIVRILNSDGVTVGTGFVVSDEGLIATCAHVVEAAGAGPGGSVRIVFHATEQRSTATVESESWRPPDTEDTAFLQLPDSLPSTVVPAILGTSAAQQGTQIQAFGFPDLGRIEGLWGTGNLTGPVTEAGRPLLQLRSSEITSGFSGGPVWDVATGHVIGMVTEIATLDRYGKLGEVALATPTETLAKVHPKLEPLLQQPPARLAANSMTAPDVLQACQEVTPGLAEELLGRHPVTRRDVEYELEGFYTSPARYCILRGPSGMGKSVIMGQQALHLLENGWAALLVRGATFTLRELSETVARQGPGWPSSPDWRQVVVDPWLDELPKGIQGLVLLIDAVDEASTDNVAGELLKLHDALREIPGTRVKVVLSCRDFVWDQLAERLPIWQAATFIDPRPPDGPVPIEVAGFSDQELDRALQAAGIEELLVQRPAGELPDVHVEAIREIVKHPAALGLYYEIRQGSTAVSPDSVTWSSLVGQHLGIALRRASSLCHVNVNALRNMLTDLTRLARAEKSRDFRLSSDLVLEAVPRLGIDATDPTAAPYPALLESGILVEPLTPGYQRMIGFRLSDVGGYLLSICLEQDWRAGAAEGRQAHEMAQQLVREAYDYPPLTDAILAWIDRLADNQHDLTLQMLLRAVAENSWFRPHVVFRLMRPEIMAALFEIIGEAGPHYYAYREATKGVRPSTTALAEIRRHLHDRIPRVRQTAVELVGLHRDVISVQQLIELLADDDRDVRPAVHTALGRIGEPAIPALLSIIRDRTQSSVQRQRCLSALARIGFRTEEVSSAIGTCLSEAQGHDYDLLRSGLWVAADLRDQAQTSHAIAALDNKDLPVVEAAARMLTEVPDEAAFPALQPALQGCLTQGEVQGAYWVVRQLLAALATVALPEAEQVIVDTLRQALHEPTALGSAGVVWAADDLGLPATHALLLEDLASKLEEMPPNGIVWQIVQRLGNVWQPESLEALVETAHQLAQHSVDLGQRLIGGIAHAIENALEHPLHDHRAQIAALHVAAKAQVESFVPEAAHLLASAGWSLDLKICDMLWVAADPQAESALISHLEQITGDEGQEWLQKSQTIRALGTCGLQAGTDAVLAYLRSEPAINTYLPRECLVPMIRRGVLEPPQLAEIVRDTSASVQGRTVSLIALGILDTPAHKQLFYDMMVAAEDPVLQAYAIRMLGFAKDTGVVSKLRDVLRQTDHALVAGDAALALARLEAHEAVTDMEQALVHFAAEIEGSDLIRALAHLCKPSSVPVLLGVLHRNRSIYVQNEVIEVLGAFWSDSSAQQIVLEQLEKWGGGYHDSARQCPALRALAKADPTLLVQRACELYDAGRLDRSARTELTHLILRLAQEESVTRSALVQLLKRLACDWYLPVRERLGQALGRLDSALCTQLHKELLGSSDLWEQACSIYTLGFWGDHEQEIQAARYASEFLIRHAADAAMEAYTRRQALQRLVEQYCAQDGLVRLSAFLTLSEQGDEQAMWSLQERVPEQALGWAFLGQLNSGVSRRLEDERRKRAREEQELLKASGAVDLGGV